MKIIFKKDYLWELFYVDKIKHVFEARGISQRQFADNIGMGYSVLNATNYTNLSKEKNNIKQNSYGKKINFDFYLIL